MSGSPGAGGRLPVCCHTVPHPGCPVLSFHPFPTLTSQLTQPQKTAGAFRGQSQGRAAQTSSRCSTKDDLGVRSVLVTR